MSAILKFDFPKRNQLHFSEENYLNYSKKRHNFACENYIFLTPSYNHMEKADSLYLEVEPPPHGINLIIFRDSSVTFSAKITKNKVFEY